MRFLAPILFLIIPIQIFGMESLQVEDRRAATVHLPKKIKGTLPLIISLHGFMSNPKLQNKIFSAENFVESRNFILITPYGKRNKIGIRYWNASDACCDIFDQNPDDISYLKKLIRSAIKTYPVDPKKVFLVGHSNGGFLAYRFACEASELISGIVSISGSNTFTCNPLRPVSILQIHGTRDRIVNYNGNLKRNFPSAIESITPWAGINGCKTKVSSLVEEEISVTGWEGCENDKSVLLWTIKGRRHNERLGDKLTSSILGFLSI